MTDHVDVIVVGAGLSGVGAVAHLQDRCPDLTWTVLEAREAVGGTWDLFRYPGVRSDSDMFTLGYAFRPWTSTTAIADGATIRTYIADTARERGIDRAVRFGHRVIAADWCSATARWTVTATTSETSETRPAVGTVTLTCRFLFFCAGYYRYERGYEPVLPGAEQFAGRDRPSAALAGGPAVGRAPGRRRRQRRHRGDAGAGAGPRGRARDDAAALAELRACRCRPAIRWRAGCSAAGCRCASPPRSCAPATSRSSRCSTGSAAASRLGCAGTCSTPPGRSCPPATTSTPTSPPPTTRGTSGCASCPAATCSGPCARGARRSSRIESPP